MRAITFLIETCFNLALSIFLIRIILQWVRGNFRNPITQVITRYTNPLILPLRKVLPPIGKLDTASLIACLAVAILMTLTLLSIQKVELGLILSQPQILIVESLRRLLLCLLQLYWVLILFIIILSWMQPNQHSPLTALLSELTEPLLKPMRRIIKPIGGLDLSPIPLLLILSALQYQFSI